MFNGMKLGYTVASGVMAACVLALASTASATVNVAQVPLLVSTGVDPNIMFILDDSGSMHAEIMPDAFMRTDLSQTGTSAGWVFWTFPRATQVYGTSDYNNNVASFRTGTDAANDSERAYASLTRSPQVNNVYYDPAITYTPWVRADGTPYPNAAPTAAYHNPERTVRGSRNLTTDNTQEARWVYCTAGGCTSTNDDTVSRTFWPAVYYWHTGGDIWDHTNYEQVDIRSTTATYTGHGRTSRTECAAGVCTGAQEVQNFANWYTYYRSRILSARSGIGRAFVTQSENMRVGFGTLNTSGMVVRGVRPFSGTDRDNFFNDLYETLIPSQGTPLRRALDDAGKYFSRTDNAGPWGNTPGDNTDNTPHLECRQSYSILMTDGYWSGGSGNAAGTSDARQNVDGTDGDPITNPDGPDYTYEAVDPFRDSRSNTLADVAMYYWNRDLRPTLGNRVPTSSINPAFWQHMVTFGVGLGVTGSVAQGTAFAAIGTETAIAWPDPNPSSVNCSGAECPARLDDLLHAAVNSRGGFFSAADPDTFAEELADVLVNITGRVGSAASVAANSTRLETGTRIYQGRFDSGNWTGDLLSLSIESDGSVAPLSCTAEGELSWADGEWCAARKIPPHASRNIVSYDPIANSGITFEWVDMNATQQALLNGDGNGEDRVDFLRGDASREQRNGGVFRNRVSVMGDIVNSAPAFMGRQDYGMYNLPNAAESESYRAFLETKASRPEVLFVGANDGMLHAIDANTGVELFAYVPNAVYGNLPELSDPDYSHRFFVDGSPRLLDVCLVNNPDDCTVSDWRTVLVGSTGAGGRSVFALDVTNPTAFGPSNVLWEYTSPDLGVAVGQPSIIKLPSGQWAAIFGNGYNSTDHRAKLIMVNLVTGNLIRTIDTQAGTAADSNGMVTPIPIDLTGNRVTDLIYAGDYHGNLWRISSSATTPFPPAFRSGSTPVPLFRAMGPAVPGLPGLVRQPISVRPEVGRHPDGGQMVYFGTGKYFETGDNIVPADPPIQTFYGIRDNGTPVTGRGELAEQTIVDEDADYRVMSNNLVDYSAGTHKGWYLDLNSPIEGPNGERVIGNAVLRSGRIIFVSVTPTPDPCDYGGFSWLMELDAISGARLNYAVFDVDGDGVIDADDIRTLTDGEEGHAGGRRLTDVVTPPTILDTGGDTEFKYMSGASGSVTVVEEAASGVNLGRQSWEQMR